jgi:hypothetical protein
LDLENEYQVVENKDLCDRNMAPGPYSRGFSMSTPSDRAGPPPALPEHVAVLAARAQLQLSPAHMAELVDAYGYVERMLGRLHRGHDRGAEPAHVFVATAFGPDGAGAA